MINSNLRLVISIAKRYQGHDVGVVRAHGSELGELVDHEVAAVVGPEVIAGSTRMKADGDAKVAIVSLLSGLDADGARSRLEAAGGVVRRSLDEQ